VAIIPALVLGALFKDHIEEILEKPLIIAIVLLVGGILLLFVDKWFNKPEKMVNKVIQDQIESALGLDSVKTSKETGIEQHRTIFDPIAGFNNSATTIVPSISDVLSKNTLTHSYELTASNISTSKD
jgi:undecaprenyl pyrophosphate phosphatase UppP